MPPATSSGTCRRYFAVKRGLRLIAEGIETRKELHALRALAVPYGQGYLLGRPQDGVQSTSWPTRIDLPRSRLQDG